MDVCGGVMGYQFQRGYMSSWVKRCTNSFRPCAQIMVRPRHEFAHSMIRFPNGIYQTSNYWNAPCTTYMTIHLIKLWHYAAVNHSPNMVDLLSITNLGGNPNYKKIPNQQKNVMIPGFSHTRNQWGKYITWNQYGIFWISERLDNVNGILLFE